MKLIRAAALTLLTAALAACGGSSGGDSTTGPATNPGGTKPGGTGPSTNTVTIADQSFSPGTITVPAGTTVTWNWDTCSGGGSGGYATCVSHNVTFDDGSNIASPTQDQGTFSRTFTTAGTYKYHCTIHGAAAMSGQVVVQ